MTENTYTRLSLLSLTLVLTVGLVLGCSNSDADTTSGQTTEQQVQQQSETNHGHEEHGHDDAESNHEEEGHENAHDYERADHFEGKQAKNYDEAVSNITEANSRLEDLLAKNELAGEDFFKIHRISYTMENALELIREESGQDYSAAAESLESFHLASEKRNAKTVRQAGEKYLEKIKPLLDKE